ncbi:hypothetical protein BD779DRAFT_1475538 [Infundibulicybe gibba]|nr:hypothetical protein BD779DRAFT_1475538 [Infundibulicybe gibba]
MARLVVCPRAPGEFLLLMNTSLEQEGDVGQHGRVHVAPLVLFPEVAGADEIQDSLSACSATRLIDKGEGKDVPYLMPETKLEENTSKELVWRLEFITTVSLTDRCGLWSKVRCHGYGRMDFFRELWNTWGIDDGEKSEGLELIGCMSFWSH